MTCDEYVHKIEQEIREEIAKAFIGILAVPLISEKTGVGVSKVQEFRREYEKEKYRDINDKVSN